MYLLKEYFRSNYSTNSVKSFITNTIISTLTNSRVISNLFNEGVVKITQRQVEVSQLINTRYCLPYLLSREHSKVQVKKCPVLILNVGRRT